MKKTIIANWGQAGQGKSTTIKQVAQQIIAYFPTATTAPKIIDYSVDIQVVITIGQIKIGIESQGDPNSRLFDSLKDFSKIGCDIIVCATRTSGATVDAVSNLHSSHGYDIIWVTNHRSHEKSTALLNNISAENILNVVQRIMLGNM